MLMVDKYRPKTIKQIIGAEYAAMSLTTWLQSWNTPKRQHRCAIVSGPPGIGKTALANLACSEVGLRNVIIMDSSRKRTKKALDEVEEAFMSRKVDAYFTGRMQRSKPGAVIMDDLDMMVTGGADRGGVSQIASFSKRTRIPIICICNDPNHRSLKTLVANSTHIRMQRPSAESIAQRLLEISRGEGLNVGIQHAREIAKSCGCDVRQSINELQFCFCIDDSNGRATLDSCQNVDGSGIVMDRAFNAFTVIANSFGCAPRESVKNGIRLYEADNMLGPMLVHENYQGMNLEDVGKEFQVVADVADAISEGDLFAIDTRRRRGMNLLSDVRATMTCAVPCAHANRRLDCKINFPSLLGNVSTTGKNSRLSCNLRESMMKHGLAHKNYGVQEFATDIIPLVCDMLLARAKACDKIKPSTSCKNGTMKQYVETLRELGISRIGWDAMQELGTIKRPNRNNKKSGDDGWVPTTTFKSALTRMMNKMSEGRMPPRKDAACKGSKPLRGGGNVKKKECESPPTTEDDEEEEEEEEYKDIYL